MNATNMRTHTVTVDEPRIRYADSGTSDGLVIAELGLGTPHLVAPDVGASAVLFLAARHPVAIRSLVVVGGGAPAHSTSRAPSLSGYPA